MVDVDPSLDPRLIPPRLRPEVVPPGRDNPEPGRVLPPTPDNDTPAPRPRRRRPTRKDTP